MVVPHDSYSRLMEREECRVHCRGMVVGCPLPGEPLDFSMREMETIHGWRKCSGIVRLRAEGVFAHGDKLQVAGCMMLPEDGFHRRHLRTLGIHHELEGERVDMLGRADGFHGAWGRLLGIRDSISRRLTEGFRTERLGGLYLAMSMGRRDLFPQAERDSFVRSSTIHVFAISGLHVNCLMMAVCLLLRTGCLGKRVAMLVALPFIVFYILLTGAGPSSMRAVLMLSGSSLALCLYRRGNDRHVFCLAALLLLLSNPLCLLHIGFQFSFLIVGVLVYSRPTQGELERIMTERWRWRRRTGRRMIFFRGVRRVLGIMASCSLAWMGCLALTLHVNRLMPFGALAVNLLVQPLAAILVEGAVPKILLSYIWSKASCAFGRVLEVLMELTVGLAEWGAREGLCREGPELSLGRACAYVLLFAIFFVARGNKALKVAACTGMALIIAGSLWEKQARNGELLLFRAETGSRTCLVMVDRGWKEALVLVPGCGESAKMAARWLKQNGVTAVDGLFAFSGVMHRGTQEWIRRMSVRSVVLDEAESRSWESSRLMASGVHVSHRPLEEKRVGYEYRHAGHTWKMTEWGEGTSLRMDEGHGGLNIYFDEGEDGLGLLSFIGTNCAGNVILRPGVSDRRVRMAIHR